MAHLKNKTIRELNEKDLHDKLDQLRTELSKLNMDSTKGSLRKDSGKLKPMRKDIARIMTRINELKRKWLRQKISKTIKRIKWNSCIWN